MALRIGVLVLAGCGGAAPTLGGTLPDEVEAPRSGASHYATEPTEGAVLGKPDEVAAVEAGVARAAGQHDLHIEGDGRLATLAHWTAQRLQEGGKPPPQEVIEFFSHHLGLVEPTPHMLLRGQPDPAALERGIADSVSQFLARQRYNYYGAAVLHRGDLTVAVVMLSSRMVELEPVPRQLPAGATIRLSGRVLAGYTDPTLALERPDGDIVRQQAGGSARELAIAVDASLPGRYGVEIIAEGPRGDSVIANFPMYVGVEAPSKVVLKDAGDAEGQGGTPDEVRQRLLALVNRTRGEAGLPPVDSHPALRQVAMAHSRDMRDAGFVGHTSPTTGSAPDRVRAAGLKSGLVLENIGRGYSARGIHRGLLKSPGHRANILNPDVTHVGIGVVPEEEGDRDAWLVTEVFVRMASKIDVESAPAQLLAMINQSREAREVPPLEADETLQKAAQAAAEAFFDDPSLSQQDAVDQASSDLRRFAIAYHRVGGVMAVVTRLRQASKLEPTFAPDARFAGIGVAQGSRPDTPSNAIAVVVMMAWPR